MYLGKDGESVVSRPLGKVTLFPTAFWASKEDYSSISELPCADIVHHGQVLKDQKSGQEFGNVSDYIENTVIQFYQEQQDEAEAATAREGASCEGGDNDKEESAKAAPHPEAFLEK